MSLYKDYIYPYLVDKLGDPPPIRAIRQQIILWAQGNVLEIGVGSGANFSHYDAAKVTKLYALEPNLGMRERAKEQEQQTKLDIEYIDLPGEQIPLNDNSIDTVVSTFTLCTIPGIEKAMLGIARVLKPTGRFIFFELGLAPDTSVQIWQGRLEPLTRQLFQGLYISRDIPLLITHAGFEILQINAGYLAQFPKSLSYCWWGFATQDTS
jgi:ubiquinone/menaquinone biosynthesis C-methylase UbiE